MHRALRRREERGGRLAEGSTRQCFCQLPELAKHCPSLTQACVLGWTRDGNHLLGYDTADGGDGGAVYFLRLWRVHPNSEGCGFYATDLYRARLFGANSFVDGDIGHAVTKPVHITIAESATQLVFVAIGSEPAALEDSALDRHITVLPSPLRFSHPGCCHQLQHLHAVSFVQTVTHPHPPLDLAHWWLHPDQLVFNRGDCIDVLTIHLNGFKVSPVSPSAEVVSEQPPQSKRRRAIRMGRAESCWVAEDEHQMGVTVTSRCWQPFTPRRPAADATCHRGSSCCAGRQRLRLSRRVFIAEKLLHALTVHLQRRLPRPPITATGSNAAAVSSSSTPVHAVSPLPAIRVRDYNLQLLAALDDTMFCLVAVAATETHAHTRSSPSAHGVSAAPRRTESAFLVTIDIAARTCGWQPFTLPFGSPSCCGCSSPSISLCVLRSVSI